MFRYLQVEVRNEFAKSVLLATTLGLVWMFLYVVVLGGYDVTCIRTIFIISTTGSVLQVFKLID